MLIRSWTVWSMLEGARNGLTVGEIHERLEDECHERTVYRTLAFLASLGFLQPGDNGRWKAIRAPASTTLPVDYTEVTALLVAEQRLAPLGDAWLGGALKAFRVKALAALNEVRRAWCQYAAQMILADPKTSVCYDAQAETLEILERGCHDEQKVEILHRSGGQAARRRIVEPRRFLYRDGAIYLVARDSASGQHKKFAVHRIESATLLEEEFEHDPDFDPDAYINASFGLFDGDPIHAVVEFDASVAHLPAERSFHPSQKLTPLPDGSARVEFDVAGTTDLVRWLAGFGGQVRVVEPAALREELVALHRNALDRE